MTYVKHNEVPKVIRDLLQKIMEHPDFDIFMIDPACDELKQNLVNEGHPWWQEKYLCLLDNPIVYYRREKDWVAQLQACATDEEADKVPEFTDTASREFRDLNATLMRILEWWLSDDDRMDDHYINMERVVAFEKALPDFQIIPAKVLKEGEPWYSNDDYAYPIIRTPRGLITQNSDILKNEILRDSIDWTA